VRVPSRDGVEIAVHDLGGDGPPILLAHATGFHGLVWDGFADRLADHFRVWSFDACAHGASTGGDLGWAAMATDVLAVIDALDLERPFGFGHSLGGGLSVLAEARRPGTFRALYLYEPAIMPTSVTGVDENVMTEGARRRRPSFPSRQDAYDNYRSKPPLNELSVPALWAYVDHGFVDEPDGTVTLACRPDDEADTFRGAASGDAWAAMDEVRGPVTVARGALPSSSPAAWAEEQAAHLRARFVILDGLAHFGPLAEPDVVAASVVEAFLGG